MIDLDEAIRRALDGDETIAEIADRLGVDEARVRWVRMQMRGPGPSETPGDA